MVDHRTIEGDVEVVKSFRKRNRREFGFRIHLLHREILSKVEFIEIVVARTVVD